MLLKTLERSILNNFTYYHIVIFKDSNTPGEDYPKAYKTERNATKAAETLFKSGNYSSVILRREEVVKQIPEIAYYSINTPIKSYNKD